LFVIRRHSLASAIAGQVENDNARGFHPRYLDIFEIVQRRDREMERIFNDLKRSNALAMLTQIRANDLLMEQEFSNLSADTRNAIGLLLGIRKDALFQPGIGVDMTGAIEE
jgi:hypothetical protein